jgi:diguanylate cyclase (GGDEF)-like protein/PAS domain S-box-containing protein
MPDIYKTLIETIPQKIFYKDCCSVYIYCNENFARDLNINPDSIAGKSDYDIFPPEFADKYRTQDKRVIAQCITEDTVEHHMLNGHKRYMHTIRTPVKNKEGTVIGVMGIQWDITDSKQARDELFEESERKYKILAENSLTGIYIHQDGKYVFVNEGFARIHGYTQEELIGKDYMLLNHPADRKIVKNRISRILQGENKWKIGENRRVKKDGTTIWCQLIVNVIDYQGQPAIMGNVIDITERKKAEEALRDEATRRRILVEQSSDGIVVLDQEGKVHESNRRFAEMLGYTLEEAHDLHVWDWDTQWTRKQLLDMIRSVGSSGDHFETSHRRKDGSTFQVEISTNGAICGGEKLVFCVCRDITERKEMERKLSEMATHDALTGLPNRLLLTDRFDIAVAQAKRRTGSMAVMMLDLDHFKYVNDTLGHDVGDKLLKAIGNMLNEIVRKGDTVARMGGDEFVLLFPEINDLQNTIGIAQKILNDFRKPFTIDCHKILITTSIGIALYPSDGEDFETLITNADKAMYFAKEEGRNNFKYTNSNKVAGMV